MSEIVIKRAAWCEHEYRGCPTGCPLEAAEGRLREAHRRWHDCADSYQDPDDFRDALNAAIQALRNVTFVLQGAKSQIPDFDTWYAKEQQVMRSDRILRWVIDSRNKVVKQGDLKTHSLLRIAIVTDYADEADLVGTEQRAWAELLRSDPADVAQSVAGAPVDLSVTTALSDLNKLDLPMMTKQRASVLFERRWVADDMPDNELLAVLAHSHGRLRALLTRCHQLLGLTTGRVAVSTARGGEYVTRGFEPIDELPLDGRLPCMASSRTHRTARRRLTDGTDVSEFYFDSIRHDPSIDEHLREKKPYGDLPEFPADGWGDLQTVNQLRTLVNYYAAMARRVLESGQDHGWFTYYFRRGRMVGNRIHQTIDSQGKQAIASNISRVALELDADAVVMLGEVWTAPMHPTPDGGYLPPAHHPEKTEGLLIDAVARSGAVAGLLMPFKVIQGEPPNRQVEVGEPDTDEGVTGLLLPTQRVWGMGTRPTGEAFWRAQSGQRSPDGPK